MQTPLANYDWLAPPQISFGWGRRGELSSLAAPLGRRAWFVVGSRGTFLQHGAIESLLNQLRTSGIAAEIAAAISHEPEVADVDRLVRDLIQRGCGQGDFLVAVGGGSAIDLAKAAAALVVNRQGDSVLDYLEGVGRGLKLSEPSLPLVAMPTTGGTGTEATKNAVISSYAPPFKKSIRSNSMVPRLVLVDPELSVSVPPTTTAYTGMDAITQLIESFVCRNARPTCASDGGRRIAARVAEDCRGGATGRLAAGARRWHMRRCSVAWRWQTPGSA